MAKRSMASPEILTKYKPKTLILIILTVLILGAVVALVRFELKYKNQFYPGVYIGGESMGGQTFTEALDHFASKVDELERDGLSVDFEVSKGTQMVNIPMSRAGLTADNYVEYFTIGDWKSDLQEAYAWGHEKNLIHRMEEQTTLLFEKKYFNFSNSLQREAVDSFLADTANKYLQKSVPATFSFFDNSILISNEVIGETIDRNKILNTLETRLSGFSTVPVTFVASQDVPRVTKDTLEEFSDTVQTIAKEKTLVFQYKGHEWKVKGTKLITWLTLDEERSLALDDAKLESYLDSTVSPSIDNPPRNNRFAMQAGVLVETIPGKSGNIIDTNDVIEKINKIISEMNIAGSESTFYVPIVTTLVPPKVTGQTVQDYHIEDLVGEMHTSFVGSTADREHNIKIGVAAINGMLIAPHAEFSTVASIGPVTEKEGYVKELVIKEHETTKEYGGGLCQVATTLFRLALNAGLPITERQNHRFVIHYYDPPGFDASIYAPHPDLRFVNDTNNYLLLQARVENKQVIMELYGQKDGRSSEISKAVLSNPIPAPETKNVPSTEIPVGEIKCTEAPHDGVTTDFLYTVHYPDGTTKEKNFHSVYQPWQKVCLIGTAL